MEHAYSFYLLHLVGVSWLNTNTIHWLGFLNYLNWQKGHIFKKTYMFSYKEYAFSIVCDKTDTEIDESKLYMPTFMFKYKHKSIYI